MDLPTTKLPPDRLCKYRSLRGDSREHLEALLRTATVYFPPPTSFNDPFDSRVHVRFPAHKAGYRAYIDSLLRKFLPNLPRDQRRREVAALVKRNKLHRNQALQQSLLASVQTDVDALGVFCLCERNDDILMWSHYADSHRGVCLMFESFVALGVPLDVQYMEEFPVVDFLADPPGKQMAACLLSKADRWCYEREWRIIETAGPGLKRFPPEMLSGIVFGCRTDPADVAAVKSWCAAGPCRPNFYNAVIKPESYSLCIE